MGFLEDEMESIDDFKNLKSAAIELWVAFMNLGCKSDRSGTKYQVGPLYNKSFQIIMNKLSATKNLVVKEVGMRLFCKIKNYVMKVP